MRAYFQLLQKVSAFNRDFFGPKKSLLCCFAYFRSLLVFISNLGNFSSNFENNFFKSQKKSKKI